MWTGKIEISRRALVAWDRVMLSYQARGLNIINLKLWNRAAICKLLWRLNRTKNSIWIKWVHGFYIKHNDIYEMKIPMQSSWVIRKIIGAREHLKEIQDGQKWLQQADFSIQKLYSTFIGGLPKVQWAKMMCQNAAPPKCLFITWLLLYGKLATCSYLQKIGTQVDPLCCLCE